MDVERRPAELERQIASLAGDAADVEALKREQHRLEDRIQKLVDAVARSGGLSQAYRSTDSA
jgi:hypothetical protein